MKTNLDRTILSPEDAKAYLRELYDNEEFYHPEDDAGSCLGVDISPGEVVKLNELMEQVYQFIEDPCEVFMDWVTESLKKAS